MKYLRKFNTEAEVNIPVRPNVVLVGDTGKVMYNVLSHGAYIQHVDGNLYTSTEWANNGFANGDANGVAVFDNRASFVIAKIQISAMMWSSNSIAEVSGVLLSSDRDTAEADFKGKENTELIAAEDTSQAAHSCANYEFPNGQKGYLPALGEWVVAKDYKVAIDEAMLLIGGDTIEETTYWSSTQWNREQAWTQAWGLTSGTGSSYKKNALRSRAFGSLAIK